MVCGYIYGKEGQENMHRLLHLRCTIGFGVVILLGLWSFVAEARCPRAKRVFCRAGWKAQLQSYRYVEHRRRRRIVRRCQRWQCVPIQRSCPVSRKALCKQNKQLVRVAYRYRRRVCYRWQCVPKLRAFCPPTRRHRCARGKHLRRVSYAYRGRRCWRWMCR
ncbi:MAG: hypothetical protein AAGJ35_08360 [Myxococcota bacterium]